MRWPVIFLMLGLSACNMAYSERPLFQPTASEPAIALRPGIWVLECPDTPPALREPCRERGYAVVTERGLSFEDHGELEAPQAVALFDGVPVILQMPLEMQPGHQAFAFAGTSIISRDDLGRPTELRWWPVLCGPPNVNDEQDIRFPTQEPWPGMQMVGDDCIATTSQAVRQAATLSRPADGGVRFHWVGTGVGRLPTP